MTPRQAFALAHPLDYADPAAAASVLATHRWISRRGDLLVMTMLAVDR